MNSLANVAPRSILNSWKEISAYLGRGVRTVQRWEAELRLPVHRLGVGRRAPVYALENELRFWLQAVRIGSTPGHTPAGGVNARASRIHAHKSAELAHKLMVTTQENRRLLDALAEKVSRIQQAREHAGRTAGRATLRFVETGTKMRGKPTQAARPFHDYAASSS